MSEREPTAGECPVQALGHNDKTYFFASDTPPIGRYMADLAKLLDMHPAPWRCTEPNAVGDFDIVDAAGECVTYCSGGNETYENGLVAAVNLAAGIRP